MIKRIYLTLTMAALMITAGASVCRADNYGVVVDAPVTVGSSANTFGSAFEDEIIGAYKSFGIATAVHGGTLADCQAVSSLREEEGMLCYAEAENRVYRLVGYTGQPGSPTGGGTWEDTLISTVNTSATAGNVGIGTNLPLAELQVGTGGPVFPLSSTGTEYIQKDLEVDGTAYLVDATIGALTITTGLSLSGGSTFDTLTVHGNTFLATLTGNVGIGTTSPIAKLDVAGTVNAQTFSMTGTAPTTGSAAFGTVSGTGASITATQLGALSSGYVTTENGGTSSVMASSIGAVAFGRVDASGAGGTAQINSTIGNGTLAGGFSTASTGASDITSQANGSFAYGVANASTFTSYIRAISPGAVAMGRALSGGTIQAGKLGVGGSIAMGESDTSATLLSQGQGSVAMGWATSGTLEAIGNGSVAMGENVQATQANSMAFGYNFINSTASSLMVGFSTTPTLTVNVTNVGIGSIDPGQQLDVNGTVRATAFIGSGLGLTGITSSQWTGTPPGSIYYNQGNVGISSTNPGQTLDVGGTLRATKIFDTGLTTGELTYADGNGQLINSANLTFDGTNLALNGTTPYIVFPNANGNNPSIADTGNDMIIRSYDSPSKTYYAQLRIVPTGAGWSDGAGGTYIQTNVSGIGTGNNSIWQCGTYAADSACTRTQFDSLHVQVEGGTGNYFGTTTPTPIGTFEAMNYNTNQVNIIARERSDGTAQTADVFQVMNSSNVVLTAIGASGNIGIGTTSTASKLLVIGGNVGIGSATPGQQLDVTGTVRATYFMGNGGGLTNVNAAGGWTLSGTNVYTTTGSNNVGIGSTAPTAKLQVVGSSVIGTTAGGGTLSAASTANLALGNVTVSGSGGASGTISSLGTGGIAAGSVAAVGIGAGTPSASITSNGSGSLAGGLALEVTGSGTVLINAGSVSTSGAFAWGEANGGTLQAVGNGAVAMGYSSGTLQSLTGTGSMAMGYANGGTLQASGNGAVAMGEATTTLQATGEASFALGENVQATAANTFALGNGFTNGTPSTFQVGYSSTPTLTVTATNVGIGSTAPAQALDVNGTVRMTGFTLNSGSSLNTKVLTSDANGNGTWAVSAGSGTVSPGLINQVGYYATAGTTISGSPNFIFNGTNVGIGGVASPTQTLEVSGGIQVDATGNTYFTGGNVGIGSVNPGQTLDVTGTVQALYFMGNGGGLTNITTGSGWTLSGTNVYLTTITNNVGIGTTVPAAALDVAGNMQFSGAARTITTGVDGTNAYGLTIQPATAVGASGTGGSLTLSAGTGSSTGTQGNGGALNISGGTSGNVTGTYGNGGAVTISGGSSGNGGPSGAVTIQSGLNLGGATTGNVTISTPIGAGASGNITVQTGTASGAAGSISLTAGSAPTPGNITLQAAGNIGIGTTSPSASIELGARKVDILSGGNVGIGSIAPAQALDVVGTVRMTGFTLNSGSSLNTKVLTSDANGNGTWAASAGSGTVNPGLINQVGYYATAGTAISGGPNFIFNGTNVGIGGVPSPSQALEVNGDIQLDGTGDTYFTGGNVGIGSTVPGQTLDVTGTVRATYFMGNGGGLTNVNAAGGWTLSGTNVYTTTSTNNVGIGTTAPLSKLVVSINTTGNPAVTSGGTVAQFVGVDGSNSRIQNNSFGGYASFLGLRADGTAASPSNLLVNDAISRISARGYGATGYSSGSRGNITFYAAENWNDTNQGTYIDFQTTAINGGTTSSKMRLDNAGNLGIGSLTPGQALDVVGTVRATYFTGNGGGLTNLGTASGWTKSGNDVYETLGGNVGIGTTLTTGGALLVMNGNVGIGTSAPTQALEINGNMQIDGTGNSYFASGNVGIGVISPGETLDVAGTVRMTAFILNTSTPIGYVLTTDGSGNGTWQPNAASGTVNASTAVGQAAYYTASGSTVVSGTSDLIFNGSNVGIGSTSPGQMLDVAGTVRATAFIGNGSQLTGIASNTWVDATTATQTMAVNTSYIADYGSSSVNMTLPATAARGTVISVTGGVSGYYNSGTTPTTGSWQITQNTGQIIHFGSASTTTTSGSLQATGQYDSVQLVCVVANTTFVVVSSQGNITVN